MRTRTMKWEAERRSAGADADPGWWSCPLEVGSRGDSTRSTLDWIACTTPLSRQALLQRRTWSECDELCKPWHAIGRSIVYLRLVRRRSIKYNQCVQVTLWSCHASIIKPGGVVSPSKRLKHFVWHQCPDQVYNVGNYRCNPSHKSIDRFAW